MRACGCSEAEDCSATSGSVGESGLKSCGGGGAIALLEVEISQLLASGDDGAGGDGEFLDRVFLVGGAMENCDGFFGLVCRLRRPGGDFSLHDVHLSGPVGVSRCVKLCFESAQSGRFPVRCFEMAVSGGTEATRPDNDSAHVGRS